MTRSAPFGDAPLGEADGEALDRDGYLLLHAAIPGAWIEPLRAAFEAGFLPSDAWPTPRGSDWRHAQVDRDACVQRLCRSSALLWGAGRLLKQSFFLFQVDGREPRRLNAMQPLHRDSLDDPPLIVSALAFLDAYSADNGATRIVPGSHKPPHDDPRADVSARVLAGEAGDVLLFNPLMLHGATCNVSGGRRRALLISYAATPLYPDALRTAALRGVAMDASAMVL